MSSLVRYYFHLVFPPEHIGFIDKFLHFFIIFLIYFYEILIFVDYLKISLFTVNDRQYFSMILYREENV